MTNAVTAHAKAERATEAAEQQAEQLRAAAERATDTADQAQQAETSAAEQNAALATITVPDDLGELTTGLAALRARHAVLDAEADAAEDAYRAAQDALDSASSETTLSVGQRHTATVHDSLTADLAAWEDRDQAASTLATATDKLTTATTTLENARASLDAARLADEAGTLRARLQPGQPCPVCEQRVKLSARARHQPCRRRGERTRVRAIRYDQAAGRIWLASTATTGTRPLPAPKP